MNKPKATRATVEKQLHGFIEKFSPAHQRLIESVRAKLRRKFPTAHELVYDNYNFFVIGYSPTLRPSDALISLVASANGVGLCFIRGITLPDPHEILAGSGKQTRSMHLESDRALDRPEVQALLDGAVAQSNVALPVSGKGELVIRSVSAKQRPRQRNAATKPAVRTRAGK